MKKVLTRIAVLLLVVVCSASAFVFSGCEDNEEFNNEVTLTWTDAQYTVGADFYSPDENGGNFKATYYEREWDQESQKYIQKAEPTTCNFAQAVETHSIYADKGFDTSTPTEGKKRTMTIKWFGVSFQIEYQVVAAKNNLDGGGNGGGGTFET